MPLTVDHNESYWLIRLEGECGVGLAAELRARLLEGLASGRAIRVDLESLEAVDITVIQLLWAAGLESRQTGAQMTIGASEAFAGAVRDAGFEEFPGMSIGVVDG